MGVQVVVLSNYIAIILGKGRTCLNQVPQLRSGFSWCSTCSSHFTKTGTTLSNSCTMSWIDEVQRGHAQGNPSAWHEESKLRNVTRKGNAFCRRKQACWPCSSPNISEFLIKSYASFYKSSKIYKILQNLMKMHFRSFRFFQFLLPSNCLGWWDSASMDPGRSCLRRTTLQEIAVFHRVQRNLSLCKYSASSNIYDL